MSPELWVVVIQFAIKFGIDATIAIMQGIKSGATIDDAIAALQTAKTKTAQQYLDEAKAKIP